MSILNKKPTRIHRDAKLAIGRELTRSKQGNAQFKKSSLQALFETIVSTLYGKDSFYESGNARTIRAKKILAEVVNDHGLRGIEFAARAISFARTEMHIRTMPIVMAVELLKLAQEHNGKVEAAIDQQASSKLTNIITAWDLAPLNALYNGAATDAEIVSATEAEIKLSAPIYTNGRKLIAAVIGRADELTDIYAYALTVFGEKGKIPVSLKRGVADAFQKFDGYQLSKYNRDGQITMKRLLRIVHATPADELQSVVFAKIMAETLEAPHTWEVRLSDNGQKAKGERLSGDKLWTDLVAIRGPGEMGYMALLRNLRNIVQAKVADDVLRAVASRISDPKEVARSKQLPWAFINASEILKSESAPIVLQNAVIAAAELSLANLPSLGERPWIILDCSTSMTNSLASKSSVPPGLRNAPIRIGAIFAAALAKAAKNSTHFRLSMFSDRAEFVDLNVHDSIMTLYKTIMAKVYGGGTNLSAALAQKNQLGFTPDAIVVISDMEVNPINRGYSLQVPANVTADLPKDALKVALNVNASESTPLDPRDGWIQLAGWSEGIFKFMDFTRNAESIVDKLFEGELGDYC